MRAAALLLALVLAISARAGGTITVGSKTFPESRLLAEIMAQLIERETDLKVVRRAGLGGTKICFSALTSGQIDLYPEYTGTAWAVLLNLGGVVSDPLRTYLRVADLSRERHQLDWLSPFGFNNTYALAMREEAAERLGVTRVSQLGPHVAGLRIGVSHEFLNRDDGFPGLAAAYGFAIPTGLRGMEHGLAYEGLESGKVDLVDAYSTDGKLLRYKVRVLEDDRRFFPPYDAAPVVREDTLERHPELRELLGRLAFVLPDERMRALNYEVEVKKRSYADVADQLLDELIRDDHDPEAEQPRSDSLVAFLWSQRRETWGHLLRHVSLTVLAMFLAIVLSVPLGIFLTRRPTWAPAVLGAAGVIQTIPSLALLAFLIPIPGFGLGATSAVAALFLYALLPITRNTFTGIREVDPLLLEAGRGMGLRDGEILRRVELPLALRTIMAGIRTSAVISVGVATLAAFIGAGGLGDPILTGLQLNDTWLVLSGAIPAALLALAVDLGLGKFEEWLAPEGL